jgi:succinyl-CoA synthetase alpha subunit
MGHAGAIISRSSGKAIDKIKALEQSGVIISETPSNIGQSMITALNNA